MQDQFLFGDTRSFLFIGGCKDGQMIDTKGEQYLKMIEPRYNNQSFGEWEVVEDVYRRETLGSPEKTWYIYVQDFLTVTQAIDMLLSDYALLNKRYEQQ